MNRLFFIVFIAAFIVSCKDSGNIDGGKSIPQTITYEAIASNVGFKDRICTEIDSAARSWIDLKKTSQAIAFVARDGKVVYNKAYGWRNGVGGDTLRTTDIFRLASQSKAIICVGLMQLFDQGKFKLDDPISNFIPEFKEMQVVEKDNKTGKNVLRKANGEITFRNLLSHRSGLSYGVLWGSPAYEYFKQANISPITSKDSIFLGDEIRKMASLPSNFARGTS